MLSRAHTARHRPRWPGRSALLAVAICCGVVTFTATHDQTRLGMMQAAERLSSPAASVGVPGSGVLSSFSPAATLPGCFGPGEQHLPEHRVLITGAAGFIGFHTSKAIATTQPGTFVLGLDNFNPLYSPALKALRRQRLLSCCNISIVQGDIRNLTLLEQLVSCYKITQVVHLAAHAGVRESAKQPAEYASSNVEGSVVLLEVMRRQQQPVPSLVYASSSSVYGVSVDSTGSRSCCLPAVGSSNPGSSSVAGAHHTTPCAHTSGCYGSLVQTTRAGLDQARRLRDGINQEPKNSHSSRYGSFDRDRDSSCLASLGVRPSRECEVACGAPASVYAATKLATEHLVAAYVHQYGMAATGLRFFTVYGSLGRPDMAVMSFTRKLLAGEPINIPCFPLQPSSSHASSSYKRGASAMLMLPRRQNRPCKHQQQQLGQEQHMLQQQANREHAEHQTAGRLSGACTPSGLQDGSTVVTKQALAAAVKTSHAGDPLLSLSIPDSPQGCMPTFRDFTAVADVVSGIQAARNTTAVAAAAGLRSWHHVINIGRGQPQSVVLLLQQLQQLLGVQGRVTYNVAGAGSAEVWVTWADTSAAEQQLGVTATTSLSEGLQEFVDLYLSDPEWRQLL